MSIAELNLLCNLVEQVSRLADEVERLGDEQREIADFLDILSDCVIENQHGFSAIMTADIDDLG